jgi:hypothetical protein
MSNENEITKYAATVAPEFTFSGAGGSIDVIAGSERAASAASQILASLGNAASIGKETALAAGVASAASFAALGELSPAAIGIAAMGGVISSISKGRR